jgi:hypothetical protein
VRTRSDKSENALGQSANALGQSANAFGQSENALRRRANAFRRSENALRRRANALRRRANALRRSAHAFRRSARSAGILPAATLASSRQGTREEPGPAGCRRSGRLEAGAPRPSSAFSSPRAAATRLTDEQAQAETRELEARFHPHFLLNALTSIVALVRMDAEAAATACRRLAEIVQRTASCAGEQYWTVGEELDLVSDYVAVQRMRFQERLHVEEWNVDSVARPTRFPRLVLQPLVENVFKHGVARSPRATHVGLSLRRSRRTLRLTIWNDTASAQTPDRLGRGLAFVIRRVRATGGDVTIETPDRGRFRVRCSIPIPA